MADRDHPIRATWALWLSLIGCLFFALAALYAAIVAETDGDRAMASLAIPVFCWTAAVMARSLRDAYRGGSN